MTLSPFGAEFSTFRGPSPGLDPTFAPLTGDALVVECVVRRWLTPGGSIPDLPGDGYDVRSLIQMRQSATSRARAKRDLEAEARKEEGVAKCDVTLTVDGPLLSILGIVTTRTGKTFRAVIAASALRTTVEEISEIV